MPRKDAKAGVARSIAIVGSGPSGCYLAQALLKAAPESAITVIDQLPTPFGLVRYGIAPDHQGTKGIDRQFSRLFEKQGVRFVGGVQVGRDFTVAELQEQHDAVVLATGLHADAPLAIEGADLAGVFGAGRITRLLNGHPFERAFDDDLGARVAVFGMGNVAIDIVRLLAKREQQLDGSDVVDEVHRDLSDSVSEIHVLSRSGPSSAKFDPVMVAEILELEGIDHVVHGVDPSELDDTETRSAVVRQMIDQVDERPRIRVNWWFGAAPERLEGDGRVSEAVIRHGDATVTLSVDSVITAIGFAGSPEQELVQVDDDARASGQVASGLYVTGWARTGPRGALPDQRNLARELADRIAADLAAADLAATDLVSADAAWTADLAGTPGAAPRIRSAGREIGNLESATTYADWKAIDAFEQANARPGRVRRKFTDVQELREFIRQSQVRAPHLQAVK